MDREESNELERLEAMYADGRLWAALEDYVCRCVDEKVKDKRRFPNAAGLARHLEVSVAALRQFGEREPEAYGRICAVLEDEALNADASVMLISAYLKQRLGYGDRETEEGSSRAVEEPLKLVFEHDILTDGEA